MIQTTTTEHKNGLVNVLGVGITVVCMREHRKTDGGEWTLVVRLLFENCMLKTHLSMMI